MENTVLKITGLTKTYHHTDVLDHISFSLQSGKIYGLIGQNGAGKTTLMRLIACLAFPTEGNLELFGASEPKAVSGARRKTGFLIEHPNLNGNMSAFDNMRMQGFLHDNATDDTISSLLTFVGLSGCNTTKTKDFSLGMKQRLGIALALLGDPELLVLDEPVNGLDPVGIVQIRSLLKQLCRERNITILISSHNLSELYQTATDYIFIHHGKIIRFLDSDGLENEKGASSLEEYYLTLIGGTDHV